MKKSIIILLLIFMFSQLSHSQSRTFDVPFELDAKPRKQVIGYYQPSLNYIIIDVQHKNGFSHLIYDTSFKLVAQYDVKDSRRKLGISARKATFIKNINIGKEVFEIFEQEDSLMIYKLELQGYKDVNVANIAIGLRAKDESLIAIVPEKNGCRFLCYSPKEKKIIIHSWNSKTNLTSTAESALPKSMLSDEEKKEKGDFMEIKYRNLFYDLSVTNVSEANFFQFPNFGQLFYNDNAAYIIHTIPYSMGINVFSIDLETAASSTKNIWFNKFHDGPGQYHELPVATMCDSLLIIQNSSPETFQYFFYNIATGKMLASYQTTVNNQLYDLVHSPLHKIGTFESTDQEKTMSNEKRFMRRKNTNLAFIKAQHMEDSLLITFGGYVPPDNPEQKSKKIFSSIFLTALSFAVADYSVFLPGINISHDKFMFAYSKFSLPGLRPSPSKAVRSYLDNIAENEKLRDLDLSNAILIDLGDRVLICQYLQWDKKFKVTIY